MSEKKYYCFCGSNCRYETLNREQILTAITQAVNEGTIGDIDTGFITTIKTINDRALKFFVGTQAEYEALTDEEREDLFALITNDTTRAALVSAINTLNTNYDELAKGLFVDGNKVVKNAENAKNAESATKVIATEGVAPTYRHVWFSDNMEEEKRAYDDDFKYNPVTNTLKANVEGHATSAQEVTTVNSGTLKFFVGTQSDFDALEEKENICAVITDDDTDNRISALEENWSDEKMHSSTITAPYNGIYLLSYGSNSSTATTAPNTIQSVVVCIDGRGYRFNDYKTYLAHFRLSSEGNRTIYQTSDGTVSLSGYLKLTLIRKL